MAGDTEAAAAAGAEIDRLKGGAAEIDAIDHTAVDPAPHQESGMTGHAAKHSPETHDDPVALHDEAAADGEDHSDGQFLFDKMSQEGLWMAVGDAAAPVVYAFIDPMCPYCARTMVNLAPEIERGELQLRVLFAPVISKSSPGKIAAIMMSEDPANAFLSHELQYAERGASDLVSQDFNELAPELYAGIRKNYDMIFDLEIPGVPFFGYRTAEGIKFLSGVPQPGAFASALPDPSTSATH